jgi:hypothetical protein
VTVEIVVNVEWSVSVVESPVVSESVLVELPEATRPLVPTVVVSESDPVDPSLVTTVVESVSVPVIVIGRELEFDDDDRPSLSDSLIVVVVESATVVEVGPDDESESDSVPKVTVESGPSEVAAVAVPDVARVPPVVVVVESVAVSL